MHSGSPADSANTGAGRGPPSARAIARSGAPREKRTRAGAEARLWTSAASGAVAPAGQVLGDSARCGTRPLPRSRACPAAGRWEHPGRWPYTSMYRQLGVPHEQSNRERHSLSATNDRVCKLLRCASPPMTAAQGAREQRRGLVSLRHAPLGGVPGRLIPRRLYREPPPNHDRTSGRDALSR